LGITSGVFGLINPFVGRLSTEVISDICTPKWSATASKLSPDCEIYTIVGCGVPGFTMTVGVDVDMGKDVGVGQPVTVACGVDDGITISVGEGSRVGWLVSSGVAVTF